MSGRAKVALAYKRPARAGFFQNLNPRMALRGVLSGIIRSQRLEIGQTSRPTVTSSKLRKLVAMHVYYLKNITAKIRKKAKKGKL